MATIRERVGAKSTRYQAIIRLSRNRTPRYREVQTFGTRADAERWAKDREDALNDPVAAVHAPPAGGPTLAALIRWYINSFSTLTPWGRTKQTALEFLERHSIGKINAPALTPSLLVEHIRARRAHGATGSTAGNDLTWIGCVLRATKDCGRCASVNPSVVDQARVTCNMLHLISRPNRREIRPTLEQLDQLAAYFWRRDQRSEIPMTDIMWFAIQSARRETEICRLRWKDNNPVITPAWFGMQSIPSRRTATTDASSTRPRRGKSRHTNRERGMSFSRTSRRVSAQLLHGRAK